MNDEIYPLNNRVLIVDDTHSIHDDYRKILAGAESGNDDLDALEESLFGVKAEKSSNDSFELDAAYQGEEAVEKVKLAVENDQPYAVAFVDVRMPPGIDGVETISRFWQFDSDVQVVICTAYSDYSWNETFEKLGSTDSLLILKKPFDAIEMQQIASALVKKWNATRAARMQVHELEQAVEKRTAKIQAQNDQLERQIDEIKRTRAQLVQAEKMAAIGQLAAGIAHEINNPVGFVRSNVNTLSGYVEDFRTMIEQQKKLVATIKTGQGLEAAAAQAERASNENDVDFMLADVDALIAETTDGLDRVKKIVADLLDFSRIGKDELNNEDIHQLIEKTLGIAQNQLRHKVEIKKEFCNLAPVICDGGKLSQVFLTLLVNAAQAIEENGVITIRTGQEKQGVWIEFQDNGCGIAEENLTRIFDPFYTTKDVNEGTGLGLHIAHNIVASHGGQIKVKSMVGKGTNFRIELPVRARPTVNMVAA